MAEIIHIKQYTSCEISAEEMLRNISKESPANAFVMFWPNDGSMPTYHCSTGDMPVIMMRIQQFIHKYYNGDFTDE